MGYKTELQSNNADLQTILNKVNALPEAGGGGGGSATLEILPATLTNNGMYEPGVNEYVLSNDNLHSSSRSIIIIEQFVNTNTATYVLLVFFRENLSNSFRVVKGSSASNGSLNLAGVIVNENSIRVRGALGDTGYGYNFVVV